MIKIDISRTLKFIEEESLRENFNGLVKIAEKFKKETPLSLSLPFNYEKKLETLKVLKDDIRKKCSILIVIGIGGSFLGTKACLEILNPKAKIHFAGTSFSTLEMEKIFEIIENEDVCINVVSKSGSTLEILVSLSLIEEKMKNKYGENYNERFYITTENSEKNLLKEISLEKNYKLIEFEKGIIGRFSVLSSSSLVPLAFAEIDIKEVLEGAEDAALELEEHSKNNHCHIYAALRHTLYEEGKLMEILAVYEPSLFYFCEWWKQLFGESEGKNSKGIYPSSAIFSRDLHSLGQYIQDGTKFFFETTINIEKQDKKINLPKSLPNFMQNLENVKLEDINKAAFLSTIEAHYEGNVPNIVINIEKMTTYSLGYLIYFFEKACYLSAKLLEVDPFSNEGVDLYKNKMKKILKF